MKEKLNILLREKGHTATSLARLLEIQPSAISHILSGRNKPSFDLVVKILRLFPDINPDWLLLDGSTIFRSTPSSDSSMSSVSAATFSSSTELRFDEELNTESTARENSEKNEHSSIFQNFVRGGKRIERVIILYSDRSFESYSEL
jgi:plasmid maintenance system antidote protein VapI